MSCRIMHSYCFSALIMSHNLIYYSFIFGIVIFKFVFRVFSETIITIMFLLLRYIVRESNCNICRQVHSRLMPAIPFGT